MSTWVLHVDDDEMVRLMIARIFHLNGIPLIQASSGREALEMLHELDRSYGSVLRLMIVTDGQMPGMNGDDLIAEARKLFSHQLKAAMVLTGGTERFHGGVVRIGYELVEKSVKNFELMEKVFHFLATSASES
ncbi:MAG: response regulator [Candidatus Uhrbacteria bacterium]